MKKYNKLSDIVANQLPEVIRDDYPTFVTFLEEYYKFLETQKVHRNVESLKDIDETLDTFIGNIKREIAIDAPRLPNERFYLKRSKELYTAHGSEDSYKKLFRTLFKKEVEVRYPQEQIMSVSDSKWVQEQSVYVKLQKDIPVNRIDIPSPTSGVMYLYYTKETLPSAAFRVGDTITLSGFSPEIYNTTYKVQEATKEYIRVARSQRQIGFNLPIRSITVDPAGTTVTVTFPEQQVIPFEIGTKVSISNTIPASFTRTDVTVTSATRKTITFTSNTVIVDQYVSGGSIVSSKQTVTAGVINPVNDITKLNNKYIYFNTIVKNKPSKNKVFVERIETADYGQDTYEIFIKKDYYGKILDSDIIAESGVYAKILKTPVSISVIKPGVGFKVGSILNIGTSQGSGLTAEITRVTPLGGIASVRILTFGGGYLKDFYFKIPSFTEAADKTTVSGFNVTPESYVKNYVDSGVVSQVTYHQGTYVTGDYTGEILADFFDINLSQTLQDNSATLLIKLGTTTRYPGYYETSTGLVSSPDSVIQDDNYYQRFSYVLKIDQTLATYKNTVMSLLHPVGRKLFAEYRIDNFYELDYSIVDPSVKLIFPQYTGIPTQVSLGDDALLDVDKEISSTASLVDSGLFDIILDISKLIDGEIEYAIMEDFFRWNFQQANTSTVVADSALALETILSKPSAALPEDSLSKENGRVLTSTALNNDSGLVFLNKYDAVDNTYFATDSYLLPTQTF